MSKFRVETENNEIMYTDTAGGLLSLMNYIEGELNLSIIHIGKNIHYSYDVDNKEEWVEVSQEELKKMGVM